MAGQDGKLRLLDGRLRSQVVLHTLHAHNGPVHDVAVSPDGFMLATCGTNVRLVNPGDPKGPVKKTPDTIVRLFDLRTNRQLTPISMITGSPSYLNFIAPPSLSSSPVNPYNSRLRLVMGSTNGMVQITDPSPAMDPSHTQILYAPLTDQREYVTMMCTSQSGQVLAAGTSAGTIAQFAVGQRPGVKSKVNDESVALAPVTHMTTPPLLSLSAEALVLGTTYCIKPPLPDFDVEPLLSSFATTPDLAEHQFRLNSSRRISADLLRGCNVKDFIGIVPNPGYPVNSLLQFAAAQPGAQPAGAAAGPYVVTDPRKLEIIEGGQPSSQKAADPGLLTPQGMPINPLIPQAYRKHVSHRGRLRMTKFNYAMLNSTPFVGLENSTPNPYTNCVLQLMYMLPEVGVVAMAAQTSHFHHYTPTTLWIELGFIFHMCKLVEREGGERVVTVGNFQRTFQQGPEAVALGLFDGSQTNPQILVQTFIRFLFQQLHRESELETRPPSETRAVRSVGGVLSTNRSYSAIDEVFGHTILSQTTFLVSKSTEVGAPIRAFSLELVYPNPKAGGVVKTAAKDAAAGGAAGLPGATPSPLRLPKPPGVTASFATAMWHSLRKETVMRGWCNASATYEPFKQVRSMITVPRVMSVLCGDTVRDPKETTVSGALGELQSFGSMHSLYWLARSHLGGPWLPTELEVAIYRDEAQGVSRLVVSALLLPRAPDVTVENDASASAEAAEAQQRQCAGKSAQDQDLPGGAEAQQCRWAIFDGIEDCVAAAPASCIPYYNIIPKPPPSPSMNALGLGLTGAAAVERTVGWEVVQLRLSAVISEVISTPPPTPPAQAASDLGAALAASSVAPSETFGGSSGDKHMVLHMRHCLARRDDAARRNARSGPSSPGGKAPSSPGGKTPPSPDKPRAFSFEGRQEPPPPETKDWVMFNDFLVRPCDSFDAVSFPTWKHPCAGTPSPSNNPYPDLDPCAGISFSFARKSSPNPQILCAGHIPHSPLPPPQYSSPAQTTSTPSPTRCRARPRACGPRRTRPPPRPPRPRSWAARGHCLTRSPPCPRRRSRRGKGKGWAHPQPPWRGSPSMHLPSPSRRQQRRSPRRSRGRPGSR